MIDWLIINSTQWSIEECQFYLNHNLLPALYDALHDVLVRVGTIKLLIMYILLKKSNYIIKRKFVTLIAISVYEC